MLGDEFALFKLRRIGLAVITVILYIRAEFDGCYSNGSRTAPTNLYTWPNSGNVTSVSEIEGPWLNSTNVTSVTSTNASSILPKNSTKNNPALFWYWQLGTQSPVFVGILVLSFVLPPALFALFSHLNICSEDDFKRIAIIKSSVWLIGLIFTMVVMGERYDWFCSDAYTPKEAPSGQCTFLLLSFSGELFPKGTYEENWSKASITLGLLLYPCLQTICLSIDIMSSKIPWRFGSMSDEPFVKIIVWISSFLIGCQQACVLLPLTTFDVTNGQLIVPISQQQATCLHKYAVAGIPVGLPMFVASCLGIKLALKMKGQDSTCWSLCFVFCIPLMAGSLLCGFLGLALLVFWLFGGVVVGLWFTFASAKVFLDVGFSKLFHLPAVSISCSLSLYCFQSMLNKNGRQVRTAILEEIPASSQGIIFQPVTVQLGSSGVGPTKTLNQAYSEQALAGMGGRAVENRAFYGVNATIAYCTPYQVDTDRFVPRRQESSDSEAHWNRPCVRQNSSDCQANWDGFVRRRQEISDGEVCWDRFMHPKSFHDGARWNGFGHQASSDSDGQAHGLNRSSQPTWRRDSLASWNGEAEERGDFPYTASYSNTDFRFRRTSYY